MFEYALLAAQELLRLCSAQIRKIAYIAPQNSDVDFAAGLLREVFRGKEF
jgi:hypothetical protein